MWVSWNGKSPQTEITPGLIRIGVPMVIAIEENLTVMMGQKLAKMSNN